MVAVNSTSNITSDPNRVLFQHKSQLDVITILLVLGEATIWKAIWSRRRFTRTHWTHWVFAVSPGWTPLAASIFAAIDGTRGPPNLIFNRAPENVLDDGLTLTNLNSGASHTAKHVILQNVWQAWHRGSPGRRERSKNHTHDVTREVGVVDVNITAIRLPIGWKIWVHTGCLFAQLGISLGAAILGYTYESFCVLVIVLIAQWLLLWAITPRKEAWNGRNLTFHQCAPTMLHMGLDSTGVLIIRNVTLNGQRVSLEEYSWEPQALRSKSDYWKMGAASLAFAIFVFQIILVGWMRASSRILYCALGTLGLITNAVEGGIQPDWESIYNVAFSGEPSCEPYGSTLMAAVGVLLAARYPAADVAAKLLYPDNSRFATSRSRLTEAFDKEVCNKCRDRFYFGTEPICLGGARGSCLPNLAARASPPTESKQFRDGLAAVYHYLRWDTGDKNFPRLNTPIRTPFQQYDWAKKLQ